MEHNQNYGYHLKKIIKGTLGEFSKIREEFEEFKDALEQDNQIMSLIELSDMLGAIHHWRIKHDMKRRPDAFDNINACSDCIESISRLMRWLMLMDDVEEINNFLSIIEINVQEYVKRYNLTMNDLIIMSEATERAFIFGTRK